MKLKVTLSTILDSHDDHSFLDEAMEEYIADNSNRDAVRYIAMSAISHLDRDVVKPAFDLGNVKIEIVK